MIDKLPPLPTAENRRLAEKQKMSLANLANERGNSADARNIYAEMVRKNPKNQEAHYRLAIIATKEGKLAEADEHFHKAWEIGPQTASLMSDMGYRLYLEHRLTEAEAILRKAVETEPQHAAANNNLGLVLGQMGRVDEAMQCFRRVNSEAEAHANMGYVLAQLGRVREAEWCFNRSLTLAPDMRSSAHGLLYLTGNLRPLPQMIQPMPDSLTPQQPSQMVAGGPSPQSPQMVAGGPPAQTQPVGMWTPVSVQEGRAPLNPQAPSVMPNWQAPLTPVASQPQVAATPQPVQVQGNGGYGVQPAGYVNSGQPNNQPAVYYGPAAPYGGMQAGGNGATAGHPAMQLQYSNGIPPQASPMMNMPR